MCVIPVYCLYIELKIINKCNIDIFVSCIVTETEKLNSFSQKLCIYYHIIFHKHCDLRNLYCNRSFI